MDADNTENDSLTMQKITENTSIQNILFSWFNEKGLQNKLQAFIREQMVCTLKDKPIWSTNKVNVTSPKVLALNLLVADFLINQGNFFTLSVLIMEVPSLGNLQEFSSYVSRFSSEMPTDTITKPSFHLNDVQDILESLGIQRNSDVTELTCQYYTNDKDNFVHSLLVCLFKAITTSKNILSERDKFQTNEKSTKINSNSFEHKFNCWLISVEDTLRSINLNEEQRNTFEKLIKNFYLNINAQESAEYKEKLEKFQRQNKNIVEEIVEVAKTLVTNNHHCDTGLLYQKEQLEYAAPQIRSEKQQLYQLINILENKDKAMNEKKKRFEDECNKKIQDIENKKKELILQEMEILRSYKELLKHNRESKTIDSCRGKQFQELNINLAKELEEIKSKLNELEVNKMNERTNLNKTNDNIQRDESFMEKDVVSKLMRENDELRKFNKVQQERIEELSNRASNLARQIEKTNKLLPKYQIMDVKKKLSINSNKKNYYSSQNMPSTCSSNTSTESDIQPEDDIIQKARSRYKMLEKKTVKMEQSKSNPYC